MKTIDLLSTDFQRSIKRWTIYLPGVFFIFDCIVGIILLLLDIDKEAKITTITHLSLVAAYIPLMIYAWLRQLHYRREQPDWYPEIKKRSYFIFIMAYYPIANIGIITCLLIMQGIIKF